MTKQPRQTADVAERAMLAQSAGVAMHVTNPATTRPEVYVGVPATLDVVLTNATGDDLTLQPGTAASSMRIFMPSFYDAGALNGMTINLPNWTFSVDSTTRALVLTYAGAAATTWEDSDTIGFSIANALTSAEPASRPMQINFTNVAGKLRHPAETTLALSAKPDPGKNASLADVLDVTLDNLGIVYVTSDDGDPLANSLFLNLKNTGKAPLYAGKQAWSGNPQITVYFVYGRTAGALAPDDGNKSDATSIWHAKATPLNDPDGNWSAQSPTIEGTDNDPQWVLSPNRLSNRGIIGIDAAANASFRFDGIISRTPSGHTQMMVHCTGFQRDETTRYDDHLFVLDIDKQDRPASSGAQQFFGPTDTLRAADATTRLQIPFRWVLYYVNRIDVKARDQTLLTKRYTDGAALIYDSATVELSGIAKSTPITVNLVANDGALNTLQFTLNVDVPPKINSFQAKLLSNPFAVDLTWNAQGGDQCTLTGVSDTLVAAGEKVITPDPRNPVRPVYTLSAGPASASRALKWDQVAQLKSAGPQLWARGVARSPNNARLYVTNSDESSYTTPGTVSVLDPTATPSLVATVKVGPRPWSLALSPDGDRLYVGNHSSAGDPKTGTVSVIDCTATPPAVRATIPIAGRPLALAVSPDGKSLYVASEVIGPHGEEKKGTVALVSVGDGTASPSVVNSVAVGAVPSALVVTPDGARLFVANSLDTFVAEVEVAAGSLTLRNSIKLMEPTFLAVTPDGSRVYALYGRGSVAVIDATKNPAAVTGQFSIQGFQMLVSPDGSRLYSLWTTSQTSGISLLDVSSGTARQVQGDIAFLGRANALAVAPDGVNLYATYRDWDNNNAMVCIAAPVSVG